MDESTRKHNILVGLFIFVGLIFLLGAILMVGNLHETFKSKMQLVTVFDEVNGLQTGANVWLSGVKVGKVKNIRINPTRNVVVVLDVEENAQQFILKNAKTKIGTDGLIGNKVVIVYGGTANSPAVQDGDTLVAGNTFSTENIMLKLEKNNENLLAITSDFKKISHKLTTKEGTIGKLINDDAMYDNINSIAVSLNKASVKSEKLIASLNEYTSKLNKKGTLGNELVTDTIVFNSIKKSVLELQKTSKTANEFMTNLKEASANPNSAIGVLLHDEQSGASLKRTIQNLETSSEKLDEDLKAAQSNFLLRGYFKDKEKEAKKRAAQD
ncbi:MlaD family protein [Flavobacterium aquicola]|uniref:Phospholipid/cholesterol/gamma-HCH transport system substrate-binding protein n=1 Tax=Flavobacterium aquicola TaxID=1682742 RepID=A0A3E0EIP0_9FLAO|nr:MlaD family protein [Flavobacterium aquicola]REG98114.1 phospholipid/cholesterol/gamma-HCH transport system substrate-binding protein [Flavobacterium aquicola]